MLLLAESGKTTQEPSQAGRRPTSWTFMPVNPRTEQDGKFKREVRSHIARRQHEQRRELQLSRSTSDSSVQTMKELAMSRGLGRRITNIPPSHLQKQSLVSTTFCGHFAIAPRVAPAPSILQQPYDPTDLLEVRARDLGTSGSTIWAYYLWQEHQHGRLFHAQYKGFQGYAQKFLHPLIRTNQAILASTTLFTGCLLRKRAGDVIINRAILRLRSSAYTLMQSTIDEMGDVPSDADILAVLKLAMFEAVFGQAKAYEMHMEALVKMVQLRRGLSNIGMDGYLAHLLLWFDANLSALCGCRRYLTGEMSTGAIGEAKVDDESFALGVPPKASPELL